MPCNFAADVCNKTEAAHYTNSTTNAPAIAQNSSSVNNSDVITSSVMTNVTCLSETNLSQSAAEEYWK